MKFACQCGNVVRDQTDNLPYKADLLPAQSWDRFHEPIHKAMAQFAQAVAIGRRDDWIAQNFGESYPRDLDDESVISDFLTRFMIRLRTIYQCDECGRLFIQASPGGRFVTFLPEANDWRDILAWRE